MCSHFNIEDGRNRQQFWHIMLYHFKKSKNATETQRKDLCSDADPGPQQDPCVVAATDKDTRTTESCGEKGMARPHSQEESTLILALAGFYCFSGRITLRMIHIYYAQVRFRQLQKTKERVLLITLKRRVFANVKGKLVKLVTLILGRCSIDFRILKLL